MYGFIRCCGYGADLVGRACSCRGVHDSVHLLRLLSRAIPGVNTTYDRVVGLRTVRGLPGNARRFLTSVRNRRRTFRRVLGGTSKGVGHGIARVFNAAVQRARVHRLYSLVCCPRRGLRCVHGSRTGLSSFCGVALRRLMDMYRSMSSGCAHSGIHGTLPGRFTCVVRRLLRRSPRSCGGRTCFGHVVRDVISAKHTGRFVYTVYGLVRHLDVSRLRVLKSVFSHNPKTRVVVSALYGCRGFSVR